MWKTQNHSCRKVWFLKGNGVLFCFVLGWFPAPHLPSQIHKEIQYPLSGKSRNKVLGCRYHLAEQSFFCLLCMFNSLNLSCLLAGSPNSCFSFLLSVFLSLFTLCICHRHIQIAIQNKFRWCRKRSSNKVPLLCFAVALLRFFACFFLKREEELVRYLGSHFAILGRQQWSWLHMVCIWKADFASRQD